MKCKGPDIAVMFAMRAFSEHALFDMGIDGIPGTNSRAIGTGHFPLWAKVLFVVFVGLEIKRVAFVAHLVEEQLVD